MIITSNNTITETMVNTYIGYVYILLYVLTYTYINKNNTGR